MIVELVFWLFFGGFFGFFYWVCFFFFYWFSLGFQCDRLVWILVSVREMVAVWVELGL